MSETERFRRIAPDELAGRGGKRSFSVADDELDELVETCRADPEGVYVFSSHASIQAASNRVSRLKKSDRYGALPLTFRASSTLRGHEIGAAVVTAQYDPERETKSADGVKLPEGWLVDEEGKVWFSDEEGLEFRTLAVDPETGSIAMYDPQGQIR